MNAPTQPVAVPSTARGRRRGLAGAFGLAVMVAACSSAPEATSSSGTPTGATPSVSSSAPPSSSEATDSGVMTYRLRAVVGPDGAELSPPVGTVPISPDRTTGGQCPPGLAIAVVGAQTGDLAVIGGASLNGAQLALDQFTAANPDCVITLKSFDTADTGGPSAAVAAAVADPSVVAVIGPTTSDEVQATAAAFGQAGLAAITPSGTMPELSTLGYPTFLRGLADDEQAATAAAAAIVGEPDVTAVCVAHAGPPIDPAVALAPVVTTALGPAAQPSCDTTLTYQQDLGPVVEAIAAASPQAIYLLTVMPQAAEFVQELRGAGVDGTLYVADLAFPVEFLAEVGSAGQNAVIVCTCQLPTPEFATDYAAAFGTEDLAMWAPEGYDLATIALTGIASGSAGDRAAMLQYLRGFDGWSTGRHYQWSENGELTTPPAFLYDVVPAA